MDSNQKLISDIKQIVKDQNFAVSEGRSHWPRSVKERIEMLLRAGVRIDELSMQIPIPRATIYKWAKNWGLVKGRKKRGNTDGKFLPVLAKDQAVSSRDRTLSRDENRQLTLRLENGLGEIIGSPELLAQMLTILRGEK